MFSTAAVELGLPLETVLDLGPDTGMYPQGTVFLVLGWNLGPNDPRVNGWPPSVWVVDPNGNLGWLYLCELEQF